MFNFLGKSWWKKLGENPIDMKDLLTNKEIAEVNNVAEEFDVEILRFVFLIFLYFLCNVKDMSFL